MSRIDRVERRSDLAGPLEAVVRLEAIPERFAQSTELQRLSIQVEVAFLEELVHRTGTVDFDRLAAVTALLREVDFFFDAIGGSQATGYANDTLLRRERRVAERHIRTATVIVIIIPAVIIPVGIISAVVVAQHGDTPVGVVPQCDREAVRSCVRELRNAVPGYRESRSGLGVRDHALGRAREKVERTQVGPETGNAWRTIAEVRDVHDIVENTTRFTESQVTVRVDEYRVECLTLDTEIERQ